MIVLFILSFFAADRPSCLERAFLDIGHRSMEEAFLYNCFSAADQQYQAVWDSYAGALEVCPEAREAFLNDTASPRDALLHVARDCQKRIRQNQAHHDSLQTLEQRQTAMNERRRQAQERREQRALRQHFNNHRTQIMKSAEECLRLYESNLSHLRITDMDPLEPDTYAVSYQGIDVSGQIVQACQRLTLDDDRCVFEEVAPQ